MADEGSVRRVLHGAHRWALRVAPVVLWVLAGYLVLIGSLRPEPEAVAIACVTWGAVLAVVGAVLPRASGEVDVKGHGVRGSVESLMVLDASEYAVQIVGGGGPAIEAGSPGVTVGDLVEAANAQQWTSGVTPGASHLTLTKTSVRPREGFEKQFGVGDTVTVLVPLGDFGAPAPPKLLDAMQAAGFDPPSPR